MRRSMFRLGFLLLAGMVLTAPVQSQAIVHEFNGDTNEENSVIIQGAGFAAINLADVSYGPVPTDNAFDKATDGRGAIVTADPGEGVMLLTQPINTTNAAIVRCSVRTDAPGAEITLASLGLDDARFLSTNAPNNTSYFVGQYRRLTTFFIPPGLGFQAIIQVVNRSASAAVNAYIDNFEVILLDPEKFYNAQFLDSDENDPSPIAISAIPPIVVPLNITTGEKPLELNFISSGTFLMGSPDDESGRDDDESPQRAVTISKPFFMSKYEVTQAQWQAVMGYNPSNFNGNPNHPVESISWNDAQAFIDELNALGIGRFRLPTEAEWEYASRAETSTRYSWGDDPTQTAIDDNAWQIVNASNATHEVGLKSANAFGLYDMSGNVWEWCSDWYGDYPAGPQADPTGPASGSGRVVRGGGWASNADFCRSAQRESPAPTIRSFILGLRVVREL
ncbi:MAG: formylglycine-generating enzyme family protein [Candidatus Hinthialibacter antarcticus]|nr:formylglycine-generating enzyme family protein [Candidatus Hinthialibacter antarcticus]